MVGKEELTLQDPLLSSNLFLLEPLDLLTSSFCRSTDAAVMCVGALPYLDS